MPEVTRLTWAFSACTMGVMSCVVGVLPPGLFMFAVLSEDPRMMNRPRRSLVGEAGMLSDRPCASAFSSAQRHMHRGPFSERRSATGHPTSATVTRGCSVKACGWREIAQKTVAAGAKQRRMGTYRKGGERAKACGRPLRAAAMDLSPSRLLTRRVWEQELLPGRRCDQTCRAKAHLCSRTKAAPRDPSDVK